MTQEQLEAVLKQLSAKPGGDGWWAMPEGTLLGLQLAHAGVSHSVARVESLRVDGEILTARTRRETHCFSRDDVFAVTSDGGGGGEKGRRPGFG